MCMFLNNIRMKSAKPKVISSKKNLQSFVIIIKDDLLQDNNESLSLKLVKLRHPKTNEGAYFAINKKVHEILKFSDEKRSYFIDNNVSSDGDLYLSTPVDPLFLIIPYLIKAKHCCPIDQILTDDEYPEIERLLSCDGITQLYLVADKKGDENLNAYIYNEDKTLVWLKKKVSRIATALKVKGIHVSASTAISANFVKSEQTQDSPESYLRYAVGILGEYLQPELIARLLIFLDLPPEEKKLAVQDEIGSTDNKKRKESHDKPFNEENKKAKLHESSQNQLNTSVVKVEKKQSTKEQARAKAAKGSKNISSFFQKK